MKQRLIWFAGLTAVIVFAGCSTIETRNYGETQDVMRIVDGSVSPGREFQGKGMLIFCSEAPGIRFEITKKDNAHDRAVAVVGKEAFAAFVAQPGTYLLNGRKEFIVRKSKFNIYELTPDTIRPISRQLFLDKYDDAYLPLTLDSTMEEISPSTRAVEPTTPAIDKITWYTGKSLYWIVAAPVYTVYYTVRTVLWFAVLRFAGVSKGEIMVDSKGVIVDWGANLPVKSSKSVLDTDSPGRVKIL